MSERTGTLLFALIFMMWGDLAGSTPLTVAGFVLFGLWFLEATVPAVYLIWLKRRRGAK